MPPPAGGYTAYRFQDPATGAPVAEWWQRAVALIIDGAIFWIPGWIIVLIIGDALKTTHTDQFGIQYQTTNGALIAFLYILLSSATLRTTRS